MSSADSPQSFESVDSTEFDGTRTIISPERIVLVAGLLSVAAVVLYDHLFVHVYLVGTWQYEPIDWVLSAGLAVLVAYGVVPLARRHEIRNRIWVHFRSRPLLLVAAVYLIGFLLAGSLGQIIYRDPGLQFNLEYLPPVGGSAEYNAIECPGEVTGDVFDRQCHGSWEFPLGTNHRGHPMGFLLLEGARVALYVIVFTLAFVVPTAVAVGVIAGLRGGLIDDVLMTFVNVQLSIPAVVVYVVGFVLFRPSILLLLVVFGLFTWGGVARLVRSETIQCRERGHVMVARSLGANDRYLARKHLLPNVTNTVVPAVFQLCALLIVVEAGIAFLGFHDVELYSWGATISESVNGMIDSELLNRADRPAYRIWWVSAFPALALTVTVASLKLVGDGLRDALDPRQH